MASGIDFANNGRGIMAHRADVIPWWGLGTVLTGTESVDEIAVKAALDWRIERARLRFATAHNQAAEDQSIYPDMFAFIRSDTKAPIGMGSKAFQIHQPREILETFDEVIREYGAKWVSAGPLFGGAKFWAQADVGAEAYVIDKRDSIKSTLLLATATDGSMNTTGKSVSTTVVCANTLAAGIGETGGCVRISHKSKYDRKVMQDRLGLIAGFNQQVERLRTLANTRIVDTTAEAATVALIAGLDVARLGKADPKFQKVARSARVQAVLSRFTGSALGADMEGMSGTAYGWLQSVTEYVDHDGGARESAEYAQDRMVFNSWYGKGDALKTEALEMAEVIAGSPDIRQYASAAVPPATRDPKIAALFGL